MTRTRAAKKAACSFGQLPFCADRYTWKKYLLPSMLFFPACKKLQLFLVGKLLGIRIVSRSQTAEKYQNL